MQMLQHKHVNIITINIFLENLKDKKQIKNHKNPISIISCCSSNFGIKFPNFATDFPVQIA